MCYFFFFFKQKTAYEMRISDWSSDVCSSDLQLQDWRGFAAEQKGIDLIVGHHPHVSQGVELNGKSLIFYGLGNFLHPGTAEMTRLGMCRDYGLMAKIGRASV